MLSIQQNAIIVDMHIMSIMTKINQSTRVAGATNNRELHHPNKNDAVPYLVLFHFHFEHCNVEMHTNHKLRVTETSLHPF